VQSDADDYQALRQRVADLTSEVDALGSSVDDRAVQARQRQVDKLMTPAGLEPVTGPGVAVVLSDAPSDRLAQAAAEGVVNVNELVVHQQDIQAVVNALWAGGATAVTVQGQRIITTTGIKCTGNAVDLQGVPYPQPYTIAAVGDPAALESALAADPRVQAFVEDAGDPEIGVGWAERPETSVTAPAYDGLVDITSAHPLR
jgi:uncharacterized protein YlxW (UPF0749 family)